MGNKVALMDNGQIVQKGDIDKVFDNPNNQKIAKIIRKDNVFLMKYDREKHFFCKNGFKIYFETSIDTEKALIHIPPEDIILSKEKLESSARNVFEGYIKEFVYREIGIKVVVDVGVLLNVFLTRRSKTLLDLRKGDKIFVVFKSSSVKVIGNER